MIGKIENKAGSFENSFLFFCKKLFTIVPSFLSHVIFIQATHWCLVQFEELWWKLVSKICMIGGSDGAQRFELVHTHKVNLVKVVTSYVHSFNKPFLNSRTESINTLLPQLSWWAYFSERSIARYFNNGI